MATRIGGMLCPLSCGNPDVSVSKTAGGVTNLKCHRCGFSGYGQPGTKAARLIEAATTLDDDDTKPAASPPAPAAPARARLPIEG